MQWYEAMAKRFIGQLIYVKFNFRSPRAIFLYYSVLGIHRGWILDMFRNKIKYNIRAFKGFSNFPTTLWTRIFLQQQIRNWMNFEIHLLAVNFSLGGVTDHLNLKVGFSTFWLPDRSSLNRKNSTCTSHWIVIVHSFYISWTFGHAMHIGNIYQ